LPVLVYFHGWYDDYESDWNFASVGDKQNYILVRPKGMADYSDADGVSWNVLHGGRTDVCDGKRADEYEYTSCKTAGQTGPCNCYTCYDDVKMFSDLMTGLMGELCIDENLVFATGGSNGAMFLYPLASQLQHRGLQPKLRAIAPFYGAFLKNMQDVPGSLAGTSVFHSHGTRDTNIPVQGGESDDYYYYVPVDETLGEYASVNGCASKQTAIQTAYDKSPRFTGCHEYLGCSSGARVVRCNFNEAHGFWEDYQEEMLWSFLGSIVTSNGNSSGLVV